MELLSGVGFGGGSKAGNLGGGFAGKFLDFKFFACYNLESNGAHQASVLRRMDPRGVADTVNPLRTATSQILNF